MDMAQTLMSEATTNDNSTDFKETPAIEDGHIGAYHDHRENRPVPADSGIELCSNLIPGDNTTANGSLLPVDTINNERDYTALDLPKENESESESESEVPKNINKGFSNFYSLLTGSVLIGGSTYTSVFNLNHSYSKNESFSVRDIILCPDRIPVAFYSTMFMTVAFTASMVGLLFPLWSIIKKWSFCSRALPLLGLAAFFASYAFTMKENVPKFWVTIEFFKISSFWLVWLGGLSLILPLIIVLFAVKMILSIFHKLNQTGLNANK
ncbi:unnamed protein product [Camellia sinensis]